MKCFVAIFYLPQLFLLTDILHHFFSFEQTVTNLNMNTFFKEWVKNKKYIKKTGKQFSTLNVQRNCSGVQQLLTTFVPQLLQA